MESLDPAENSRSSTTSSFSVRASDSQASMSSSEAVPVGYAAVRLAGPASPDGLLGVGSRRERRELDSVTLYPLVSNLVRL